MFHINKCGKESGICVNVVIRYGIEGNFIHYVIERCDCLTHKLIPVEKNTHTSDSKDKLHSNGKDLSQIFSKSKWIVHEFFPENIMLLNY